MQYKYVKNYKRPCPAPDINSGEKKFVRFFSNRIGSAFLFGQLAILVLSVILTFALMIVLGFDKTEEYITNDYALLIEQIVFSAILFVPTFFIAKLTMGNYAKGLLHFKIYHKKYSFYLFLVALGFTAVSNILTDIISVIFSLLNLSPMSFTFEIPHSAGGVILYLLTLAVAPAIVEEYALRGVTLGALRNLGDKNALIISSLLFALMHANFIQIPFALLMGLILGYLTLVTGSIIPAVVLHFINNLLSGLVGLADEFISYESAIVFQWCYYTVFLALGVIGYVLLKKNYSAPFLKLKNDRLSLPGKAAVKTFFLTSPATIIICIYFIGSAVFDLFGK